MSQNIQLDIVDSVTVRRKQPVQFISSDLLQCLQVKNCTFHGQLPGRMISSAIVMRQLHPQTPIGTRLDPCLRRKDHEISEVTGTPELLSTISCESNGIGGLRSPFIKRKAAKEKRMRKTEVNIRPMTRLCSQTFSHIMANYSPKKKAPTNPSASVKRIVKGSGLLRVFGSETVSFAEEEESGTSSDECSNTLNNGSDFEKRAIDLLVGDEQLVPSPSQSSVRKSEEFVVDMVSSPPRKRSQDMRSNSSERIDFAHEFQKNIQKGMRSHDSSSSFDSTDAEISNSFLSDSPGSGLTLAAFPTSPVPAQAFPEKTLPECKQNNVYSDTFTVEKTIEMEVVSYLPIRRHRRQRPTQDIEHSDGLRIDEPQLTNAVSSEPIERRKLWTIVEMNENCDSSGYEPSDSEEAEELSENATSLTEESIP